MTKIYVSIGLFLSTKNINFPAEVWGKLQSHEKFSINVALPTSFTPSLTGLNTKKSVNNWIILEIFWWISENVKYLIKYRLFHFVKLCNYENSARETCAMFLSSGPVLCRQLELQLLFRIIFRIAVNALRL